MPRPPLPQDEADEADGRPGVGDEHLRAGPAQLGALDDAVDEGSQSHERQPGAHGVERRGVGILRRRGEDGHGRHHEGHDRKVGEEDRAPPEVLEQGAGQDGPERSPGAGEPGPGGDGLAALLGREDGGQQGERGRHDEGGADPGDHPAGDHLGRPGAEPAHQRAGGEDEEPEDEGPLASEAVPQGAGRQEQGGEHQGVRVDDPLEGAGAGTEVALHAREGDVEPRHRHDDHDEGQAHDPEEEPPAAIDDRVLVEWPVERPGGTGKRHRHVLSTRFDNRVYRYETVSYRNGARSRNPRRRTAISAGRRTRRGEAGRRRLPPPCR